MKSRISLKPNELKKELLDDQSVKLLQELHLVTRHGSLNADARRKLKQINHLVQLLRPSLDEIFSRFENPTILDLGAGKAYLGFILYELFMLHAEKGKIISVETRKDLFENAKAVAQRLDHKRMEFFDQPISEFIASERIHMLTALHACDTATDDALALGIRAKVDHIAVVPCCQAELAQLLRSEKGSPVETLWHHGIHRREFGSHLSNVLRTLILEANGYQVTVTELVGWEHSLKNEIIIAKRVQNQNSLAQKKLDALMSEIKVKPKLYRDLYAN